MEEPHTYTQQQLQATADNRNTQFILVNSTHQACGTRPGTRRGGCGCGSRPSQTGWGSRPQTACGHSLRERCVQLRTAIVAVAARGSSSCSYSGWADGCSGQGGRCSGGQPCALPTATCSRTQSREALQSLAARAVLGTPLLADRPQPAREPRVHSVPRDLCEFNPSCCTCALALAAIVHLPLLQLCTCPCCT